MSRAATPAASVRAGLDEVGSSPRFTIVMAAHNAATTIRSAIASALNQTMGDLELVVVDDGSTDDTAARVEGIAGGARLRLVRQENAGPAVARNTGAALARGRYVSFLDSDDLLLPDYLEQMTAALEADRGAGWAYTDPWVLDDRTRRIRRHTLAARNAPPGGPPGDAHRLLIELVRYNFVFVASTVRREVLEDVGGFTTGLVRSEDYDLWLRLAASGHRATRTPSPVAIYRKGGFSRSTERSRVLTGVHEIIRRVAEEHDVPDEARAAARERMAQLEECLAFLEGRGGRPGLGRRTASSARALAARLAERRKWPATPPPAVVAAFPDLTTV